ncbi:3-deoxy-7-phosphoheptulonate synthase [Beggiatoa leptomitoformis]|uniref:Phospho-2-dehydro-3-deoxyheptonate aldolase n=1 Tax=Beggiatoa leptomitoformis TaxID=288004 RepID=A0A2N9YAF5_9GAMM|nr:3-deoxy-7-phosphoheptulonate synthase [Beggiatoa leptomitoformis]ALG67153.1 3-deoxy-7-phosphoheptulonate synthase [Beggiatoa leptomitoformis]AUI67446.1 3-deoxy-7-phosphoheptulonate synthase [Beggiatoa leptomitoformis]
MSDDINNVNVVSEKLLITPDALKQKLPCTEKSTETVRNGRKTLQAILDRQDHRIMVVTGPCSIHDMQSAKEYAERLKKLHDELQDSLFIVMRVYFEKPRTTVGWKGFINDPRLDDSFHIEEGLAKARELLLWVAELGLPAGTEALDPITPQYLADLFSWSAIGARTTESQTHRELASGLSMPVGFKNGTDGNLDVAINALHSASAPHHFLGIDQRGQAAVIKTCGNKYGHVILRGGKQVNYDSVNIALCEASLLKAKLPPNIVVDCSHGNSNKKPELQPLVADNITNQIIEGNTSIVGLMLESHLQAGNQPIAKNLADLKYGMSVTDACIDWETTEQLLRHMHQKLQTVLPARLQKK